MSLDDFIKKYEGKGIDVDGFPKDNPNQCVDLYRQYVREVLEYPQSPPVEGAKDIWNTYLPEYFQRIENTPYGVPEKGDIVIFGTGLGRYGHVAIFLEGNASRFTSLDQNYPTGSLVHKQGHTYSGVIGWLRPIKNTMEITEQTIIPQILSTSGDAMEVQAIRSELYDRRKKQQSLEEENQSLKEANNTANQQLADKALEVNDLRDSIDQLKREKVEIQELLDKARAERDKATGEAYKVPALEALVEELEEENSRLKLEGVSGLSRWQLFLLFLRGGEKV